jgi:hypothetical protein
VSSLLCSVLGCILVLLFALYFLWMGSHPCFFYIQGFSPFFVFQLFEKKCWCGATRVEQLLSMRDKSFYKSKTSNESSRQIKYSFKVTHPKKFLQSDGYTG